MAEIDLLESLNHKNIVRYITYCQTSEHLNIVMEYIENGSLQSILKKYGNFPELLIAVYIAQVLEGLIFLHDEGVIHRDIKAANILVTKDSEIKIADFGVASLVNQTNNMSVMGSPYWMAPEIIDLSGATTKSDIWSVGCTVIELLTGAPPYFDLVPMSALFRIVQDDSPPIPETVSPSLREWLMDALQKDPSRRLGAQQLLKHRWITDAKRTVDAQSEVPHGPDATDDDPGVGQLINKLKNEKLKKAPKPQKATSQAVPQPSPQKPISKVAIEPIASIETKPSGRVSLENMFQAAPPPPKVNIKPDVDNDWDEAFDMEDIPVLHLPASPKPPKLVEVPKPTPKPSPLPLKLPDILDDDLDCFEDDHPIPTAALTVRSRNGPLTEALRRPRSSSVVTSQSQTSKANTPTSLEKALAHIQANTDDDSGSFDLDIGIQGKSRDGGVLELKIKAPVAAHDEAPEDDIFDAIETSDDEEDEEKERQKQEIVSKVNEVSNFEKLLKVSTPEPDLIKTLNSLTDIFGNYTKQPAVKPRLVKQGLMTYVQLLSNPTPNVLLPLLRLINQIITNCPDLQLSMAILGVIPAVTRFASTDFLTPVRAEVAKFVQSLCPDNTSGDTTLQAPTAQMFMSCSGPSVLVSLIRSYYADNRDIVSTGIDTIVRIFGPVQGGAAPNNDICRLFAYSSLADTIIEILPAVAADKDPASSTVPLIEKMTSLLRTLAQADLDVKEFLVKPKLLRALLPILDSLPSIGKLNIIKCFRGLSSSESLSLIPALQQAGLVTGLVERLDKIPERDPEKLSVNIRLEMLTVLASLCSLNSEREIEAVDAGIVPHLVKYSSDRVLRPPCIQLLVELPSISAIRPVLWKHGVFDCMLRVLQERGYMSMALECIAKWSETEKEPVSRVLKHTRQIDKLMTVFEKAEAEANIVSPLGRIIKSSSIVTRQVAHTAFVGILLEKMMETSVKAEVKIQLMQMLQHLFSKCSSHRKAQLIAHFSMKPKVEAIKEQPGMPKIVVRLAGELLAEFEKAPPPSSIPSSLASSSVSPSLTSTPELTQLRESLSSQNLLAQTTPGSSLTITLTPSAHSRESFQRHMHRHSHSTSSHNS